MNDPNLVQMASTLPPLRQRLGDWLSSQGMITPDQLHIALLEQKKNGLQLGKTLVALGFISDAILREALAAQLGWQSVDLSQVPVQTSALALIPKDMARSLIAFPLKYDATQHKLTLAVVDPNNLSTQDRLRQHLKHRLTLELRIATEAEIIQAIDLHYGIELSIDSILQEIENGETDWHKQISSPTEYGQPVVRLIDALLVDAVTCNASDIHLEPEQSFIRIRYRIDGVLQQIRALHKVYWPAMVVRIKVMSGMNIAETRSPQDGHISLTLAGRLLDFRVSIQPTLWGENLVLRILDRQKGLVPLGGLGLSQIHLNQLKRMIARPEGILLVTGPTGAGKTTTLYSILGHINSPGTNIMTLEDPVEYPLAWLRQTSVNETVKMDFVSGIRAMLRQDPDIILIGEIRDRETAEMAFRAAMTGHQVYSTLHTQSAIGTMARLQELGIPADIMASNMIGIVAQRLVRRLCPYCREAYTADDPARQILKLPANEAPILYRARGCSQCSYSGYRGRFALMELLHMNRELEDLLARRAPASDIRCAALADGFQPLLHHARLQILQGKTSLAEVARVIDLTRQDF